MSYNTQAVKYITKGGRKPVNYDFLKTQKKGEKKFGNLHGSALSNALKDMKAGLARGKK